MPGSFRPLLSYPEFNGHRLSRTSIQLRFAPLAPAAPLVISGWKSITTDEKLTPGKTYGNRSKAQGRTRGKHEATAELEIYAEDAEIVRLALAAAGAALGLGWMETPFALGLNVFERVLGGAFLWESNGCRVVEDNFGSSDNDDQLTRKWSIDVMDMRVNGVSSVLESTSTGLPG